jgi:hypothetical protein
MNTINNSQCPPRRQVASPRALLALAVLAASATAHADIVASTGPVTVIVTYANFGSGDFAFRISNQPAGCYGFWLSPQQPGFKTSVAFILQARATGEPVLVGADKAQLWTGSGAPWCKVDYVGTPY